MNIALKRKDVESSRNERWEMASLLLEQYGPLMTLCQIAELLGRSQAGVRVGLYSDNETSALLLPAKIKIGRRIYFRTAVVGAALDSFGAAG